MLAGGASAALLPALFTLPGVNALNRLGAPSPLHAEAVCCMPHQSGRAQLLGTRYLNGADHI